MTGKKWKNAAKYTLNCSLIWIVAYTDCFDMWGLISAAIARPAGSRSQCDKLDTMGGGGGGGGGGGACAYVIVWEIATQPSHSVDRAGWQAKMASIELCIQWCNAVRTAFILWTNKVSSDTIIGWGATLIFKLSKMKLFRASQSSVVHVEAVLTSNQSPV